MNRQERRAAARGKGPKQLMGLRFGVTVDETVILEEALALWIFQTEHDLPDDRTPAQVWALQRAEKLRQAFRAAIDETAWHDIAPQRHEPRSP